MMVSKCAQSHWYET